jgi:hypothetical protein
MYASITFPLLIINNIPSPYYFDSGTGEAIYIWPVSRGHTSRLNVVKGVSKQTNQIVSFERTRHMTGL